MKVSRSGHVPVMVNGYIWLSTPKATVALTVKNGIITVAPPYARKWAQGRTALEIVHRYRGGRGVEIEWFEDS